MPTPSTSTRLTRLPHSADLVRSDAEDDADLVTAAEPRVRSAQIALGEGFDVRCASLGGDLHDAPADLVIAMRAGRVGHAQGHPRVPLDVLDLLEALDGVDDDVLAVGVDPGLGHLRCAVGHQGSHEAETGLVQ